MTVRIAIDCMGGDHGLAVTVPAALTFAQRQPGADLLLVGRSAQIDKELHRRADYAALRERVRVVQADEVVEMSDSLATALRSKKNSSMRVALECVRDGLADVVVSAGNTGALMAIARYVLKTQDGIDRPAIAHALPNQKGGLTTWLDLGANVDCEAEHLLQFAILGCAYAESLQGTDRPSVGLLNVGEEVIKGNEVVKRAGELLRASGLNFFGNVEGDDIFRGTVDVIVCDGFVGNVALKTSEGLAQMLAGFIREEFTRSWATKLIAVLALPVLNRLSRRVDHRRYNGAALLGLRGVVIKSHGSSDAYAFECAIGRGFEASSHHLIERTAQAMAPLLARLPTPSDAALTVSVARG
ncbi:MAG TPA: phosphate acyltransferase PlsX [Burkholderiaceae bacterium]|nr:phosphate acyltransferase PlsX [Burkholderiaceae bacterium]